MSCSKNMSSIPKARSFKNYFVNCVFTLKIISRLDKTTFSKLKIQRNDILDVCYTVYS